MGFILTLYKIIIFETFLKFYKTYMRMVKASFWGLFKTNFYGHFRELFVFTKFNFTIKKRKKGKKVKLLTHMQRVKSSLILNL